MSSLRARCFRLLVQLLVRRRHWGPPQALARRARRVFGAPRPYGWLRAGRVRVARTRGDQPAGEWLMPAGTTAPVILYLHGGGYVSCSPLTHRPITAALARLVPGRVFSVDYRLAPEHPYPAALDDAERAYRWLLDEGIAPHAIALAGDSAGGGLALALLLRLRSRNAPLPACAVLFSPWTDLTGRGASVRANDGQCAMFRPENIAAFAACYAPPEAWVEPEVSPLYGALDRLPPVQLQVAADELLRDDAEGVHRRIQDAGGTSELVVFGGVFHVWQMLDGIVPEARMALEQAAQFIRARTAP